MGDETFLIGLKSPRSGKQNVTTQTAAKRHFPLVGISLSIVLFVLAAAVYPGGTLAAPDFVGYDWRQHAISTMFPAEALNGQPNPARYYAIPAALLFCSSMSVVFWSISRKTTANLVRKAIEIGGIGSMVYGLIAVTTRMHDLLVTIGLGFYIVAALAVLFMLFSLRQTKLFVLGMLSFTLKLGTAVIYYGNVFYSLLAAAQKFSFAASIVWFLAVYYADLNPAARSSSRLENENLQMR